uniref:SEC7 domain-containing protein n=1 Tax=Tanacetum cinerariifolium TaxID=118510 RepID=A0A6L2JDT9_TANCI|nr:hypothetical protein [Tanacetum cinerariifolium]
MESRDGLSIVISPLLRIHNKTDIPIEIRFQQLENEGNDHASVVLKSRDTIDDSTAVFDALKTSGGSKKTLISLSVGNIRFPSDPKSMLTQWDGLMNSKVERSSVNLYANPMEIFFTVTLNAFGVRCKPVNCGDWAKMLLKKKKDDRNLDMELNFGDGKFFGCLRLSCGHRGILELKHKLHDGAKVAEKHSALYSAMLQLASDFDGGEYDVAMIGDYLGQHEEFPLAVMHAYVDSMNFAEMKFHTAICEFLRGFWLPCE